MKKLILITVSMLVVSNAAFSLTLNCKHCVSSCVTAQKKVDNTSRDHEDEYYKTCTKMCHEYSKYNCQRAPVINKVIKKSRD